ncbi:MAG: right-handed parallel beta-helix repeat-containing protein [Ignavibacteria bacterium]|nr:right-handed parallel beta-helix repeat-containing protein [Ignavibacteria bacterium]
MTYVNINTDAFYEYAGSSNSINVVNNIFANSGYLSNWNNVSKVDLAALQAASGKDVNSVSSYPSFVSSTDLHSVSPWLNAKATTVASVGDDIDGQARNVSTPDIGADEFTPTAPAPLAGTYTIGGTSPSYATMAAAISDALLRGVSDTVRFKFRNGVYTVHSTLLPISGSTPSKPVIFESESGNSANVTLFYAAAAPESNYVVQLFGADNIWFQNLTLAGNQTPGATYGLILYLSCGVENLKVQNCMFSGTPSTSSTNNSHIYANQSLHTSLIITNNTFTNGGYGVYLISISNVFASGTQITNNTFTGQGWGGVYLNYQDAPMVNGNTITGAGQRGIELDNCNNDLQCRQQHLCQLRWRLCLHRLHTGRHRHVEL